MLSNLSENTSPKYFEARVRLGTQIHSFGRSRLQQLICGIRLTREHKASRAFDYRFDHGNSGLITDRVVDGKPEFACLDEQARAHRLITLARRSIRVGLGAGITVPVIRNLKLIQKHFIESTSRSDPELGSPPPFPSCGSPKKSTEGSPPPPSDGLSDPPRDPTVVPIAIDALMLSTSIAAIIPVPHLRRSFIAGLHRCVLAVHREHPPRQRTRVRAQTKQLHGGTRPSWGSASIL